MTLRYTTNQDDVQVYDRRGNVIATIAHEGTPLLVVRIGATVPGVEGEAYVIAAPRVGLVLANVVRVEASIDPQEESRVISVIIRELGWRDTCLTGVQYKNVG